ncbi:TetR family transcriptional regulator [Cryptosporangium minutisporangium]|uniref:HTH tetR-type domain-containing protein n=1 Tax=Cryptosporangium minutisporangium TaxID=113569 RepID=A0ABP6SS50_9ACTN
MAGGAAFDLSAEEIVRAAVEILKEQGLDAVSMRTVAARLGVSPVPLYSRVGNKEALLDAVADEVLADVAPEPAEGERWQDYTARWASDLRERLKTIPDLRRLMTLRRSPFLPAARILVSVLRTDGRFTGRSAVEAVQLVSWAVIGGTLLEPDQEVRQRRDRLREYPSDPSSISEEEADRLAMLHVKYIVQGVERDAERTG